MNVGQLYLADKSVELDKIHRQLSAIAESCLVSDLLNIHCQRLFEACFNVADIRDAFVRHSKLENV